MIYKLFASLAFVLVLPAPFSVDGRLCQLDSIQEATPSAEAKRVRLPASDPTLAVTYKAVGGFCIDGQGGHECVMFVHIRRDGTFSTGGDITNPKSGKCDPERMKALLVVLDSSDYELARSQEPGPCWSHVDGRDPVVSFHTKLGIQRIADCETRIDWKSSPFQELAALLEQDVRPNSAG